MNYQSQVSLGSFSGSNSENGSHRNNETQDQIKVKNVEAFDKEVISGASKDNLQSFEKNAKRR